MKTISIVFLISLLVVLAGCGKDSPTEPDPTGGASIEIGPAELTTARGEAFGLTVSVDNISPMFAANLELAYDDTELELVNVIIPEGGALGDEENLLLFHQETPTGVSVGVGRTDEITDGTGLVTGPMLEFIFQCRKNGEFSVDFCEISGVDENGMPTHDEGMVENSEVKIHCQ